ncbi:MAG: FliH/SctL family protein [Alphaproteobacteria bacterium]|nr:FliH/SctL family protein [Alphaproteobacteria bacterium]
MTQRKIEAFNLPCLNDAPNETKVLTRQEQLIIEQKGYNEGYQKGYDAGYEDGRKAAILAHEHHQNETLDCIENHLNRLHTDNVEVRKYAEDTLKEALKLSCEKLFPFYLKKEGKNELIRFIDHVLGSLLKKDHITITVHPAMADFVNEQLLNIKANRENLTIVSDADQNDHACHIHWPCGGAIFDMQALSKTLQCLLGDEPEKCEDPFYNSSHEGE